MKQIAIFSFICLALGVLFTTSCKKSDNSIYFYNESRDTMAPTIQTNAPLNSEIFYYGDDIHIVGNVVDKETDMYEIDRAIEAYRGAGINSNIYLMPVGGTDQLYFNNFKAVAEMAMKRGWRYSPRLQVDIWRNAWGT